MFCTASFTLSTAKILINRLELILQIGLANLQFSDLFLKLFQNALYISMVRALLGIWIKGTTCLLILNLLLAHFLLLLNLIDLIFSRGENLGANLVQIAREEKHDLPPFFP